MTEICKTKFSRKIIIRLPKCHLLTKYCSTLFNSILSIFFDFVYRIYQKFRVPFSKTRPKMGHEDVKVSKSTSSRVILLHDLQETDPLASRTA